MLYSLVSHPAPQRHNHVVLPPPGSVNCPNPTAEPPRAVLLPRLLLLSEAPALSVCRCSSVCGHHHAPAGICCCSSCCCSCWGQSAPWKVWTFSSPTSDQIERRGVQRCSCLISVSSSPLVSPHIISQRRPYTLTKKCTLIKVSNRERNNSHH